MASANITTAKGRERLPDRREPYWHKIEKGRYIGFRKTEPGGTAGGSWILRFTQDGTRKYHALGKESEYLDYQSVLSDAQKWFAHAGSDEAPVAGYTVAKAVEDYLKDLKLRKGAAARKEAEYAANRRILPELGTIQVSKLTTRKLKSWRDALVSTDEDPETIRRSKDTANRVYATLRAALNLAFKTGAAPSDAAWRRFEPFKGVGKAREVFLTREQAQALLDACTPELRNLVKSLLVTGARFGELARRKVGDFDREQGSLNIPDGKTGKRDVVLTDEAIAHFKELSRDKLPGALLHTRADGSEWDKNMALHFFKRAVVIANKDRAKDRLPADTVLYSLRHTHASWHLLAGVNAQVLAENMGTSVHMLEKHYAKFMRSDRRAMFNRVAAL